MSRLVNALLLFVLLFSSTAVAFAQEELPTVENQGIPEVASVVGGGTNIGTLNCFDYYNFGSVQAELQPALTQTVSGATMEFTGSIKNENNYALLDGTLFVKIFFRDEAVFSGDDGYPVVDQFVIAKDITLKANNSLDTSFTWEVPNNAKGGEYYAAYFYTTSDRYNLMGLPFTDDVVGNQAPFTVTSDNTETITTLSKADTTINGQDYNFVGFPLQFEKDEIVTIKTTMTNSGDSSKTFPIQWNQYAWSAQDENNLRNTKTEVVTIAAGETKEVSYEVKVQREAVVFVTAVAQDGASKSFLNIRYIRSGVEETRINFPGVASFPLQQNTKNTLFGCAHSTVLPLVSGNTLTLALTDKDGNTVHQYVYEGDITAAMSGFGEEFTPTQNYNEITLTATMQRNGIVVEEVVIQYDCTEIDEKSCLSEPAGPNDSFFDFIKKNMLTIILIVLGVIAAVIAFVYYKKHRASHSVVSLFFLLFLTPLFLFSPLLVQAKSTVVSGSDSDPWIDVYNSMLLDFSANFTVNYFADVINVDTGSTLNDGDAIPVGTRVRFVPKPRVHTGTANSDIHWNFTGGVYGTPYGYWGNGPANFCGAADNVGMGQDAMNENITVYTPFTVPIVSEVITPSGVTLTDMGGGVYRVDSGGTLNVNFRFPSVSTARFNYTYRRQNSYATCRSRGVNYVTVPEGNINFSITVVAPNTDPNTPSISGPTSGTVSASQTFNFTGTDPDGDTLRYGVDWDNNGSVDQWVPSSGYINSGTQQSATRSWGSSGTYTFQVRAQDSNGANSGWASHSITLTPLVITADLTINGSNGPLSVFRGNTLNINWSSSNATSCTIFGANWGSGQSVAVSGANSVAATVSDTYTISCGGVTDTVSVTVVNQVPNPPSITGPTNAPLGASNTFTFSATDPDNDQVYYGIDWDLNGSVDAATPASGYVNSGTGATINRTWSTAGSQTFRARTYDAAGGVSGWTQHTIVIGPSAPTGMTAAPQACNSNQMYLDWSDTPTAASYSVYYSNGTFIGNSLGSNYMFTGTANQNASFFIRANNSANTQSANSGTFSGTVPNVCLPAIPTGLSATPQGCSTNQINVSWNTTGGASGYDIEISEGSIDSGWIPLGNVTSYSHGGLNPSTIYSYRIRAWNGAGAGAQSGQVSATAPMACAPSAPTGMTAAPQACSSNQLYLDWADTPTAASYSVYYSNGTFIGNSLGSNYMFTGTANQNASFFIRANNSANTQSANSGTFSGTVPNTCPIPVNGTCGSSHTGSFAAAPTSNQCGLGTLVWIDQYPTDGQYNWDCVGSNGGSTASCSATVIIPPPAPTGLSATPQACDTGQINVTWNGVGGALGYDLQIDGGGWSSLGNVTSYSHGSLSASSNHTYHIRAWNSAGAGAQSGQVSAIAPMACAPGAPTGMTAAPQACSSNQLYLDWADTPTAASYSVYYSDGVFIGNSLGSDYMFSGPPGQNTSFYIRANNSANTQSVNSSVFSGTVPMACAPGAPTGMTATPQACSSNQLYLDWADTPTAASYSVYYSDGNWINNSIGSNYLFTGPAGQNTSFYIRANNSANTQSVNSSVFSGVVPSLCAPASSVLEVQINGGSWNATDQTINPADTVSLRWSSSNATTCSGTGSGFDTGNNISGTDAVNPPAPNTTTVFTVTCNGVGGPGSDTISLTTRQIPNLTTPLITYIPSTGFDPVTGIYDSVQVIFQTSNNGGSDTSVAPNYQFQFDRGINGYDVTTIGSLGILNAAASVNRTEIVPSVPLGGNRIQVTVDSSNVVSETDEGDNVSVLNFMLPPPNPGLNLTADRLFVRNGETTTIRWSMTAIYPMNCRVRGPGMDVNPSGTSGTRVTQPVYAKNEYTFTCTEPTTNVTFTDSVIVEAQGVIEEL